MSIDDSQGYDLLDRLAEEFAARFRRGERPVAEGVHRPLPGAGRRDPRAVPGAGQGRAGGGDLPGPGRGGAGDGGDPAAVAGRRLPDPPRDRPRRHGGRLRGRAGLARPPRGPEGPAAGRSPGTATSLERFRREARASARLHHTNIVPVFEVGQEGDVCYYAMQFIQGQSLDAVIDELRRLRGRSPRPRGRRPARGRPGGARAGRVGHAGGRRRRPEVARSLLTRPVRAGSDGRADAARTVRSAGPGGPGSVRTGPPDRRATPRP